MKNLILFMVLTFALSKSSFGQIEIGTETLVISLNATDQINKGRMEVSKGRPLILKFVDINPLKYRYAINHELVSLFSDESDISFLKGGGVEDFNIGDPSGIDIEKRFKELSVLQDTRDEAISLSLDSLKSEIDSAFKKQIIGIEREILEFGQKGFRSIDSRIKNEKILNIEEDNYSDIKDVEKLREYSVQTYLELLNSSKLIKDEIEAIIAISSRKDQIDFISLQEDAILQKEKYEDLIFDFNLVSLELGSQDDDKIKEIKEGVVNNLNEIGNKIRFIFSLQNSIQTLPVDHQGENLDYIDVTLEVIPINDAIAPTLKIQKYDYKVWIKGGLKVDFSAGLFLSSLRDKSYFAEKNLSSDENNDNLFVIKEEDKGDYEFGVGSMVNLTYRSSKFVNFGLGVGGYITSDQKFRFISGPTIVLGKMQRALFSFGVVLGEVTSVSNKVNFTDNFDLGEEGNIPTLQKFDFGHYFSFTYNLSKVNGKKD